MSLKDGFTGNALSTEKGSAGIDMVLLSFMVLVFLAAPLLMSVFEVYTYVMQGAVWSGGIENALDQGEWQLNTEALSECERNLMLEETRKAFAAQFDDMRGEGKAEAWAIQSLAFIERDPPCLEIRLRISYEPVTMMGLFISQGGLLDLELYRVREFPMDR